MQLRFFEDFHVGEVNTSAEPYPVTEEEIVDFARRWDPQDFHIDRAAAEASVFRGFSASGTHVLAIRNWLIHRLPGRAHVIAALGLDEVRFLAPVRPGDELTLRTECIEARISKSNPDRGLLRFSHAVLNQRDEPVLTLNVALLVKRRPGADSPVSPTSHE